MRIPRIYQSESLEIGQQILLDDNAAWHVGIVLRLEIGDKIILFNHSLNNSNTSNNSDYFAEIAQITRHKNKISVTANILEKIKTATKSVLNIRLIQAVCRNDKMDFILQKATELGVSEITPVTTEYGSAKLFNHLNINIKKIQAKITHWQKIIISSCEQCGRNDMPEIQSVKIFSQWLSDNIDQHKNCASFLFDPRAKLSFSSILPNVMPLTKFEKINVLIGPEGGFSEKEIEFFLKKSQSSQENNPENNPENFYCLKLGNRILRTETAGIAAISALQALGGDFY